MKRISILFVSTLSIMLFLTGCGNKSKKNGNSNVTNNVNSDVEQLQIGPVANTKDNVIKDYELDGILISNVAFISENDADGTSTFSARVTNITDSEMYVKSINIILKDANGEVIKTILGYIGENLQPNASSQITTDVFMDINTVESVEYVKNN